MTVEPATTNTTDAGVLATLVKARHAIDTHDAEALAALLRILDELLAEALRAGEGRGDGGTLN
jgi:hypothetical protein